MAASASADARGGWLCDGSRRAAAVVRGPRPRQQHDAHYLRPLVSAGPGDGAERARTGYRMSVGEEAVGVAIGGPAFVPVLLPGRGNRKASAVADSATRAISRRVLPLTSMVVAKVNSACRDVCARMSRTDCQS